MIPSFGWEKKQEQRKSANHRRSLLSCFVGVGDHYFLVFFFQATTLKTRKSANHNGRSLFSCFFGMANHHFLAFFGGDDPRNPEICKSQREITILEICKSQREIAIFLLFFKWEITIFLLFFAGDRRLQKKQENSNLPL